MKGAVLLLLIAGVAFPYVVGYHVDPVRAQWSGWTRRGHTVAQSITCNFDSLSYVELFAGDSGATDSGYHVGVYEGGVRLTGADGVQHQPASWVRFDNWSDTIAFTKGKQYEFKFTRSGSDSIQYYYDLNDPYQYGETPNDIAPNAADLCMRVYGRMNAVDSVDFGADEFSWLAGYPSNTLEFAHQVESAHVRTVRLDLDWHLWEYSGPDDTLSQWFDASMLALQGSAGCRIVGLPTQVPDWASSRIDMISGNPVWCIHCAPQGLERPVDNDSNYLAHFLKKVLAHCESRSLEVHDWECFNEVNDVDTTHAPGVTGFWQHPNFYYDSAHCRYVGPGLYAMCSLYVRMAEVMASAIRSVNGHGSDRIGVNSMAGVTREGVDPRLWAGKEWLRTFYDVVKDCQIPHFWNAITVHAYHNNPYLPFTADVFEADAETLRSIMREHGDYGELWNTEFSMPKLSWWDTLRPRDTVTTEVQSADYCSEMFTTAEGMKGLPGGSFDRDYWWLLRQPLLPDTSDRWGCWSMVDTALLPHFEYYAFKQTAVQLTGKRFNGRVMTGDSVTDALVRTYEFEDPAGKRMWVSWRNELRSGGNAEPPPVAIQLPARTDRIDWEYAAYGPAESPYTDAAALDGWYKLEIGTRPRFITEPAAQACLRPDLRVDSVKYIPPPGRNVVRAWVTNHGNRATPHHSPGIQPYPIWAVLYANGDSLAQQVCTDSIGVNQQVGFTFNLGQTQLPDTALLSVRINPGQTYVELGTDDNSGHALIVRP